MHIDWTALLQTLTSTATIVVVLGFLGRSVLSNFLTRDINRTQIKLQSRMNASIEETKARLKTDGDIAIERVKQEIQAVALEHELRFRKAHEKQAEVIEKLY